MSDRSVLTRHKSDSLLSRYSYLSQQVLVLRQECLRSTELIFRKKLNWLLIFAPVSLVGNTRWFGESTSFVFAGLALIPLAERLSFVTEEVAGHTNQTIGALLNATFGNAPELLISSAALKEGFYRVVQLTLLGSILTNLLFVFGLSCLIGGLRFQVQVLRNVSGNASIGMLMLAVAGLALPAALMMSDEMKEIGTTREYLDKNGDGVSDINDGPSIAMIGFSRFNAVVMVVGYLMYLILQLGSHQNEFEDEEEASNDNPEDRNNCQKIKVMRPKAQRNKFCRCCCIGTNENDDECPFEAYERLHEISTIESGVEIELPKTNGLRHQETKELELCESRSLSEYVVEKPILGRNKILFSFSDVGSGVSQFKRGRMDIEEGKLLMNNTSGTRGKTQSSEICFDEIPRPYPQALPSKQMVVSDLKLSQSPKSHCSDSHGEQHHVMIPLSDIEQLEDVHMSFRMGLMWLFIITLIISAMSDILVDTIDGFAYKYGISEVFTSLVILPYFSNIAEQVSAIIFAFRNEMDLCVGITVGSAIQISLFILPGSVLIGWAMDRSMSLFFRGFETCCLIFSVTSVAAVLHGGTTNWLVGVFLVGVYFMIAAGFWFHELENLSIDGELENDYLHNQTSLMYPRFGTSN